MKKAILFFLFIGAVILGACMKKTEDPQLAFNEQLSADDTRIARYIAENNINATRHESGIYYEVIAQGEGNHVYTAQSQITVKYTGRLLNGVVFDRTEDGKTASFSLGGVILGWQIGMQYIQKGGKIRLIVPSGFAYGAVAYGSIPANSPLDFDIELIDIK